MSRTHSPSLSTKQSKTSFNMPVGLKERFKMECIKHTIQTKQPVQMQDVVSEFVEAWTSSSEKGLQVPTPDQLKGTKFKPAGKVIHFPPQPAAPVATSYNALLDQIISAGGPKAEAIKSLLLAMAEEKTAKHKRTTA